jgi:3-phosphoshikimate 1-carboxyvinyltransferase
MLAALRTLGAQIEERDAHTYVVTGAGGPFPATEADLFIGNAGTAARFLTAAVVLGRGHFSLDGSEAMRKRPIEPLIEGLRQRREHQKPLRQRLPARRH